MPPHRPQGGLYTPDDMLWRVHRELLMLLAGTRALLLEVAHPLVATGVAEHSQFERRPLKRLYRTVRTMQKISFGDAEAVRAAALHVHRCHQPVKGRLLTAAGPFPAGTPYDAADPALGLWVFATLVDSILLAHDHFVRPLTPEEKTAYYADSQRLAQRLGVPARTLPPTYSDFVDYVEAMVAGEELAVGETARAIAAALFGHPTVGWLVRMAGFAGVGLLPDHLRRAYGLAWSAARQRRLHRLGAFLRRVRPLLPDVLCTHPQAWLAERRYRRQQRRSSRQQTPGRG